MDELEQRIEELEVKLAFQDDLVLRLDLVVRDLDGRLAALADELQRVKAEVLRQADLVSGPAPDLLDEKPPHY
jgi:uncharacterized coiled-coil protein SlyX